MTGSDKVTWPEVISVVSVIDSVDICVVISVVYVVDSVDVCVVISVVSVVASVVIAITKYTLPSYDYQKKPWWKYNNDLQVYISFFSFFLSCKIHQYRIEYN